MRAAIIAALLVLAGCAAPHDYQAPAQASHNLAGLTSNQPIINACQKLVFEGLDAYMKAHPEYVPTQQDIRQNLSRCYIEQGITI